MHPEAEATQQAIYKRMTVEAKLLASQSLREFAWELRRAAIRRARPDLTDAAVLDQVRASFGHGSP